MKNAYARLKNGFLGHFSVDDILSGRINESDIVDCYCSACGKPAFLRHFDFKVLHFACYHLPGCSVVEDGKKHRTHTNIVDYVVNTESMINYIDRPVTKGPNGGEEPGSGGTEFGPNGNDKEIDEIDAIEIEKNKNINTVSGLISCYRRFGGDFRCSNGQRLKDIVLTRENIRNFKREGIRGPLVVTCVRVHFDYETRIRMGIPKGYCCFMDRYSGDPKRALYFLVKLNHLEQNERFTSKLLEKNKQGAWKYKYVVLYGNWEKCEGSEYLVYKATINSHCYAFINIGGTYGNNSGNAETEE